MHAARSKLKNHENTSLQSVYFNEDLDKNSSELYYKARMAKKQKMIKSVWTYGCQVYFTKLGSEQPSLLTDSRQLPLPTSGNVSRNINDSTGLSTTLSSGSLRSSPSPRDGGTPGSQAESTTSQSRNQVLTAKCRKSLFIFCKLMSILLKSYHLLRYSRW